MGGGLHHIFHFRVKSLDRQKKHRSVENFELLHVLFDRTTYPPPRKLITGLMQITGPLPAALEGPGPVVLTVAMPMVFLLHTKPALP